MKEDFIERGLHALFAVRYLIVDCSESVRIAQQRHSLDRYATDLCAQLMLTSSLLSAYIKDKERLTVQLQSNAPKVSFTADINAKGEIRAKLTPNKLTEQADIIDGVLLVVKYNQQKELYRGITNVDQKNISDALQHHLTQSTQIDSIVRFFISETCDQVQAILLEKLPSSEDLPSLSSEDFQRQYKDLHQKELNSALETRDLRSSPLHLLDKRTLKWTCKCSRQRVVDMLCSLGRKEIQGIIDDIGYAEVTCHFCNEKVHLNKAELLSLFD